MQVIPCFPSVQFSGYRLPETASALNIVGVFNGEGPPVHIPNTEVKLTSAENTCLATDREDRSMPTQKRTAERRFFFCVGIAFIVHEEGPSPLLELLPLLCGRKGFSGAKGAVRRMAD